MRCTRRSVALGLIAAGTVALAGSVATADDQQARDYVVVYETGQSLGAAHDAVEAAGGTIVSENSEIGVATVRSKDQDFAAQADKQDALVGAATDRPIGHVPAQQQMKRDEVERLAFDSKARSARKFKAKKAKAAQGEPLASRQWDMQMIHATAGESYARQRGSHQVRVGVIDTGIDASHPDIKPNFDRKLSRNFTVDDPIVDGTCDTDPDHMAPIRPTSTRKATARTWPARSARRSTASAWPAWPRRSTS
jgi:hypothetical protein